MDNSFFARITSFLIRNKFLSAAIVLLLICLLFLTFSTFLSPTNQTPEPSPTIVTPALNNNSSSKQPYPTQTYMNEQTGQEETTNALIEGEPLKNGWVSLSLSNNDLQGIYYKKATLSDGTTQYTVSSINQNRPNEIIVKDNIIIFQRALVSGKTIDDYTNVLGQPENTYNESRYYGSDTLVYLYPSKGIALVAGPKTRLVFEQLAFQPMSLAAFKQKYGAALSDELK